MPSLSGREIARRYPNALYKATVPEMSVTYAESGPRARRIIWNACQDLRREYPWADVVVLVYASDQPYSKLIKQCKNPV